MYIKFTTYKKLHDEVEKRLEKDFGFEIVLDCYDDEEFEYWFGRSEDNLEDGEDDPLDYDEAVRCCGVLWREGIFDFGIEGNGGWAMSMIQCRDFTNYAMTAAEKEERARTSAIFWAEADHSKVAEIVPSPAALKRG